MKLFAYYLFTLALGVSLAGIVLMFRLDFTWERACSVMLCLSVAASALYICRTLPDK